MSEAGEGRVLAERRWAAKGSRWAVRKRADVGPPPLGTEVDGYRLETRLGEGGQGTVYRARRGGRLYALKFLSLASPDWAWRELEVRLRLRRVGELAVESHGLWPHQAPRFLYLVTPYVHGRPLYAWARGKNPTARDGAWMVRWLARQLAAVHAAGVVHRDVKGANVLVRKRDGRPVLVDFGVGAYVGAPEITSPLGLPGTRHYRSPEALRFRRERAGEHYPARASDDLWASGVVLYRLLTGVYPFDAEMADEGVLADLILKHEPEPPHVRNPRVPRALSELCLRMLEKSPEARFPDAEALGGALEAVLAEADASWDVPLCAEGGLEGSITSHEKGLSLEDSPPPPPRTETGTGPWRALIWGGAALTWGLVVLVVLLRSSPGPAPERPAPTPEVSSPSTMLEVTKPGQEVASQAKPPEGARGAAPHGAATPAPVASATPRKDSTRVRIPQKAPTPRQQKQQDTQGSLLDTAGRTCVLVWVAGQLACASPEPQIRPLVITSRLPPPAECPAGSVETMREVGRLSVGGARTDAVFLIDGELVMGQRITVRPGQAVTLTTGEEWGGFPEFTVYSGQLLFGEGRVYGRFTQARTPEGLTYSVCLDLYDASVDRRRGVVMKPGSSQDSAIIWASVDLLAVKRFE